MNKRSNTITASRMTALASCPRRHFYAYELGLKEAQTSDALSFGTAWHKAMEMLAQKKTAQEAFQAALEIGMKDEKTVAVFKSLLIGYYENYSNVTEDGRIMPEVEFDFPITRSTVKTRGWQAKGKIDGIIMGGDNGVLLREYKTTSQDVDPQSDYWLGLRDNIQMKFYAHALSKHGYKVAGISYDVVRKPTIRPKSIAVLDSNGDKQVFDATNQRVYLKNGKPKQSVSDGEHMAMREESAEEFGARLLEDIRSRPYFYYQRKAFTLNDHDVSFVLPLERKEAISLINHFRKREAMMRRSRTATAPCHAWPKAKSFMACDFCPYSSLCLNGIQPDREEGCEAPAGFRWGEAHEELTEQAKAGE